MKPAIISALTISIVLISGCKGKEQLDKNRRFVKYTDVEVAGLKGKVKSIITYRCPLGDSVQHCYNINKLKFNERGYLTEEIDTTGLHFFSDYKAFYNEDGLLTKSIYTASEPIHPSVDTYMYSFNEGKKTRISRNPDSSLGSADTSVYLYDKDGNELEYKSIQQQHIKKYDEHGFLIWSRVSSINNGKPLEVSYENDDKGRILKQRWSSNHKTQTHVYNSDGNEISEANIDSTGKKTAESFTGYCEFDKNGNYLKSITVCLPDTYMYMTRRVIEYY